jgi:hypothetical protein
MECFVGLGRFSPVRRGIFPDDTPTGEGSMQCRKNPDGDPESSWALPNIMEQYGRTHTGEQRVIQKGRWLC